MLIDHLDSKMTPTEKPMFSAYPYYTYSSTSWFFNGPAAPDMSVFCLDHPSFGTSTDFSKPLAKQFPIVQRAYGLPKVGDIVSVLDPNSETIASMMLVEKKKETCVVSLSASSRNYIHSGIVSTREVPNWMVFSGFPAKAIIPSTPIRVLKNMISGASRDDRGMWPDPVSGGEINFFCNGQILDEEIGVGTLMKISKRDDNDVVVVMGSGRGRVKVPWIGRNDSNKS